MRDSERRDVYYYRTDLVHNGGNHKIGDHYNVRECFSGVFTGLWKKSKGPYSDVIDPCKKAVIPQGSQAVI